MDCKTELDNLDIEYGFIQSVTVNTRAKKRWGMCTEEGEGIYKIEISSKLLKDDVEDIHAKNTIIHEILHTCDGCLNHGKEWQRLANKVNNAYGYNIKRTTSYAEKGIERPTANYIVKCPCCNAKWEYMRMTKTVQFPNKYQCSKCNRQNAQKFANILYNIYKSTIIKKNKKKTTINAVFKIHSQNNSLQHQKKH